MVQNYELANDRSVFKQLITPSEKPRLAIFNCGVIIGVAWAFIVFVITILGMKGLVKEFIQFLEIFYRGYSSNMAGSATSDYGLCAECTNVLLGLLYGFVHGFLFGITVALIYNWFRAPYHCGVKLTNASAITQTIEPHVISDGVENGPGKPPFTIAIIANPILETQATGELTPDPIFDYPDLFIAKVACIIGSLASSDILIENHSDGKSFLDKMRIITFYNPSLPKQRENALCLEREIDTILEPQQRIWQKNEYNEDIVTEERLKIFLKNNFRDYYDHDEDNDRPNVDVVYAVSASYTHSRSSASYTVDASVNGTGFVFKYEYSNRTLKGQHKPYPNVPGMVAYWAFDNRLKLPVHEFAHAMSSTTNGLIFDEYYDEFPNALDDVLVINKERESNFDDLDANRSLCIERSDLPDNFATYNGNPTYPTDKDRIVPCDWTSFVPKRQNYYLPCTMDRSYHLHKFDILLEQFIKDRLTAKINRQEVI